MRILTPALLVGCAVFLSGPVLADETAGKENKETETARAYVGSAKCKMCHSEKITGDPFPEEFAATRKRKP